MGRDARLSKKFANFDFVERQRVGDGTSGMDTFARQFKNKRVSFWYCARLFVSLTFVEDTFARQFKNKRVSFWYCPRLIVSLQA